MKKVKVTIAQATDGTYWCHAEQDVYGGGLNGAGKTVKEAKDDLMSCLDEAREDYIENGGNPYPVEFSYQYDLQSFFDYFSFLNVCAEPQTGPNDPGLSRRVILRNS